MTKIISEDEYLALHGVGMPISDYMLDKQKIPHGETESQKKNRLKEADRVAAEYADKRQRVKAEYRKKIESGELRQPTEFEKLEITASGHPDNQAVHQM